MLLARRLMSVNVPEQEKQHLRALRLAAREFNSSLSHYTPNPPPGYLQVVLAMALPISHVSRSLIFNMQAAFAKDRSVVYRSYGDALAWSGRPDAAALVFKRGLREGLWPHGPHCRPARSRPVVGIPLHTEPARVLFPHVALKLESALEIMQHEFDGMDHGSNGVSDVWVQESAGLHSHGSTGAWHVLLLIKNGQPQRRGCTLMPETCALLMSLPSVRHLRDGQVNAAHATGSP
jgi:hypothetical protein